MRGAIYWFRQGPRITDNTVLFHTYPCKETNEVISVYLLST